MLGIVGMIILVALLLMGMNVGICMLAVGFIGYALAINFNAAIGLLKAMPFATIANFNLAIIPLFILMGQFCFHSGISSDLYETCYKWMSRMRGGLSVATIGACALFSAVCGSSPAAAATMGTVCLPEMRKYNYENGLSTGCLAAGGTLGIMLPPSIAFILYGIATGNSIGALFAAGIVPGLVLTLAYVITALIICKIDPSKGPKGEIFTLSEKIKSLKNVWSIVVLFVVVIGGIFLGYFTPNESSAVGAFGAFIFLVIRKKCTPKILGEALFGTVKTAAMILMIILGATIFGKFLTITKITTSLARGVSDMDIPPLAVICMMLLIYIVLGFVMDSLAMLMLLVPIFYPIVMDLGMDPIWFGVLIVLAMETGQITPPIGINVFVIAGVAKDIPLFTIYRGVAPFLLALVIVMILMIAFPPFSTALPSLLY